MELLDNFEKSKYEISTGICNRPLCYDGMQGGSEGQSHDVLRRSKRIVGQMLQMDQPYHCPHGRPTTIAMSQYEFEKKIQTCALNVKKECMDMKKPIIVLTGPTAVGKTEISIELAKAAGGEIISADSMQVYKQMDIGTAKIKKEQMQGVTHYMIDEWNPDEEFNVMIFQKRVKEIMEDIYNRGKIPILVGGTGFYIQAVLNDIAFTKEKQGDEIERICKIWQKKKVLLIYIMNCKKWIKNRRSHSPNNIKRVIRALEYFQSTGQKFSDHNKEERQKGSPYNFLYLVLTMNRKVLYERIDKRLIR